MVLGVRLNIEAGRFPAVSALAARCNTQLIYTDTSLHPHKHLFAARKKKKLYFCVVLCKTTLPPTIETERTLIKSLKFEDSFQSLYAWMPVLHGVRSNIQLRILIHLSEKVENHFTWFGATAAHLLFCSFTILSSDIYKCGEVKTKCIFSMWFSG